MFDKIFIYYWLITGVIALFLDMYWNKFKISFKSFDSFMLDLLLCGFIFCVGFILVIIYLINWLNSIKEKDKK